MDDIQKGEMEAYGGTIKLPYQQLTCFPFLEKRILHAIVNAKKMKPIKTD